MRLIANWKHVLRRSWSVWCAGLAGVMGSAEAILPLFQDQFPRGIFALLTVGAAVLAIVARVIEQKEFRTDGH